MKKRFLIEVFVCVFIASVFSCSDDKKSTADNDYILSDTEEAEIDAYNDNSELDDEHQVMPDIDLEGENVLDDSDKIIKIRGDAYNTCAINGKGVVSCWGSNEMGGLGKGNVAGSSVPVKVYTEGVMKNKKIKDVTTGFDFSCSLDIDGKAYCWGDNRVGQLGNGTINNYRMIPSKVGTSGILKDKVFLNISAGGYHACAIDKERKVYCWGSVGLLGSSESENQNVHESEVDMTGVLKGKIVKSVSTGGLHTCVLDVEGKMFCWGKGNFGQLGNNTLTTISHIPVEVDMSGNSGNIRFSQINSGYEHTCAITEAGKEIYCWGRNYDGQLGDGTVDYKIRPEKVKFGNLDDDVIFKAVSASVVHTCAIDNKNRVYCWGKIEGFFSNSEEIQAIPVKIDLNKLPEGGNLISIVTGTTHNCVLDDMGEVYCWGINVHGVLGTGSFDDNYVPDKVIFESSLKDKKVVSISSGTDYTCAVDSAGKAYCWGNNAKGVLGNGNQISYAIPKEVYADGILKDKVLSVVYAGSTTSFAIDIDGFPYFWGEIWSSDENKQLLNLHPETFAPEELIKNKEIVSMSSNGKKVCMSDSEGKAYCWGDLSIYGLQQHLLDFEEVDMSGVSGDKVVKSIEVGEDHTCILTAEDKVYCWGANDAGQLGTGTKNSSSVPAEVDTTGVLAGKKIVQIDSGRRRTCALDYAGSVYCWGAGMLGDGTNSTSYIPVKVDTSGVLKGKTIVFISSGSSHNCAIDSEGKVYCWGYNTFWQIGDGTNTDRLKPVKVDDKEVLHEKFIVSVSCGEKQSCAVDVNGKVYCWGSVLNASVGNGAETGTAKPVEVFYKVN